MEYLPTDGREIVVSLNPNYRQIELGIRTDKLTFKFTTIGQYDINFGGGQDYMFVGNDISLGIDQYSGTEALARVTIEGENEARINEMASALADIIKKELG